MKEYLKIILESANDIADIARCDMDCFGADFFSEDYRNLLSIIEHALTEIDKLNTKT